MIQFNKGANGNEVSYPFTQETVDGLIDSDFVSPRAGENYGLRNVIDDQETLADEIVNVRLQIQRGEYPLEFLKKYYPFDGDCPEDLTQPLINEGLSKDNPNGLADIVHMDTPMDMPIAVLKWLVDEGCLLKDNDADYVMFTSTILDVIEDIADGVKRYGNRGFDVKYYYGVGRPEEVDETGISLTHYPEGCPNHPSYPAGHGAIAGGSVRAFFKHFDLDPIQQKVILDTAYLWAMFRSFAGVHYGFDNVAGLWLGLKKHFTNEAKNFYKE